MSSNNKSVNIFCFDGSHNTAELMYYDAGMTSVYRVFLIVLIPNGPI